MKRLLIIFFILHICIIPTLTTEYSSEMLERNEFLLPDEERTERDFYNKENLEIYKNSFMETKSVDMDNLILTIKALPLDDSDYPFDEYLFFDDGKMLRKEYLRESKLGKNWKVTMRELRIANTALAIAEKNKRLKIRTTTFYYDISDKYNSSTLKSTLNKIIDIYNLDSVRNLRLETENLFIFNRKKHREKINSEDKLDEVIPPRLFLFDEEVNIDEIPVSIIFEITLKVKDRNKPPIRTGGNNVIGVNEDGIQIVDIKYVEREPSEPIEVTFWVLNNRALYKEDFLKELIDFLNYMSEIYGMEIQN